MTTPDECANNRSKRNNSFPYPNRHEDCPVGPLNNSILSKRKQYCEHKQTAMHNEFTANRNTKMLTLSIVTDKNSE